MSDFNEFRQAIGNAGGFASPSRFRVLITLSPNAPQELQQLVPNRLLLRPEVIQIPGTQIGTYENATVKNLVKYPNIKTYEDISMTFLVTSDYQVVKFFKAWHQYIIPNERWIAAYTDDFSATLEIECLDKRGAVQYTATYTRAWPVGVNSIDLDSGAVDIPMKLAVSFTYE